jgi:hypothetical protein
VVKDTLTLGLEGDIALSDFAKAMQRFTSLLDALSKETSVEVTVEWVIQELYSSSAVATVQGVCEREGIVERIVDAYGQLGEALASGQDLPFSPGVRRRATKLTEILDSRITSMRFETPDRDVLIAARPSGGLEARPIEFAYGTVTGTVQMLTMRRGLRFSLYDTLFDRAISCFLTEGREDEMRNAWGKRAVVAGKVGREPEHGRPVVVRDVTEISIVEGLAAGTYKRARGVIPWAEDDERPEAVIRRLREANDPRSRSREEVRNAG